MIIQEVNYLRHIGVLGMHWGIRKQYQMVKAGITKKDVDSIISTMTSKERRLMGVEKVKGDIGYMSFKEGKNVVKRFLLKDGKTPVAFFDLLDTGKDLNAVLGTRKGPQYRNKGYGTKSAKKGLDWYTKNKDRLGYKHVVWFAEKDNIASQKVAEKNGLKLDKNYKDDQWTKYLY